MDRRHPVYSFRRAVRYWSLRDRSCCDESRSILHPTTDIRPISVTEGIFPTGKIPDIPLDPYHVCMLTSVINKAFLFLQNSFSLLFGEHSTTLSNLPTPQIEPHVRFLRHRGFCVCPHTGTTHYGAPRDECVENSRNGHQGCDCILRRNIHDPPLDLDHVCCGKGMILCASARRV